MMFILKFITLYEVNFIVIEKKIYILISIFIIPAGGIN